MNSEIQQRLLRSVFALFMPMARLMLRYGITFDLFSDVAKEAFVRAAFSETDGRGRGINASRVAVKTGISRKEVSRIRDLIESGETTLDQRGMDRSGPPAKVLHAWHTDPRFADAKGVPRALEFDGSEVSFAAIVRAVAGDVPPGAVRAELRKAGAILDTDTGNIIAVKRYFVPGNADEKTITSLSGILFPLMSGIDHNSDPGRASDGYIQRFAFSDSLAPNLIPVFRDWSRREATKFIESIDDWFAEHESESADGGQAGGRGIVGIGVYYYQGPSAEDLIPR